MYQPLPPPSADATGTPSRRGTLRHFDSATDQKAEEYRYWQSRPVHERLAAVSELSIEGYKLKGTLPRDTGLRGPAGTSQR